MNKSVIIVVFSLLLSSCGYAKKDAKLMSADEIIKMIDKGKPVQLFDKIITDDLDFTKVKEQVVDGNANLIHKVNNDIVFVKCVFLGKVIATRKEKTTHKTRFMSDVTFKNCDFRNGVDLSNSTINGNLNMSQSVYRENVNIDGVCLKGNSAQLWEVTAEKEFSMVSLSVLGSLNMLDANFFDICNLQSLDCRNLQFSNVRCDSVLDLSMSKFSGDVIMNYCEFNSDCRLSNCRFNDCVDIIKSNFNKILYIENSYFWGKSRFNGTKVKGNIESSKCYFLIMPEGEEMEIVHPFGINQIHSTQIEIK